MRKSLTSEYFSPIEYYDTLTNQNLLSFGIDDPLINLHNKRKKRIEEIKKMVKNEVKELVLLDNGQYEGVIVGNALHESKQGYVYHDTEIEVIAEGNPKYRAGCPNVVSEGSKLGSLLMRFGASLKAGEEVDSDDYLKKGLRVKFMIKKIKNSDGQEFSNIVIDTLSPA